MTINKTSENGVLTVSLGGRLDTATAPELEKELNECLEECEELVFDLEGLEYMSSAGLRLMLSSQKKMADKGGMKVTHVNQTVMEIFEVTGFCDILTIE